MPLMQLPSSATTANDWPTTIETKLATKSLTCSNECTRNGTDIWLTANNLLHLQSSIVPVASVWKWQSNENASKQRSQKYKGMEKKKKKVTT